YRLPVDERSDQYALAVVAYELMTGRKPLGSFSGPSEKDDTLSSAVDAACLRALSEDPEDRYESVSAFVADLDAALGATSRRKFIERPVPVIAGAVALGILIAGAWGFGNQGLEQPNAESTGPIADASEGSSGSSGEPSSESSPGPSPRVRVIDEVQGGEPPRLLTPDGLTQEELDEFNELMVLAMSFGENQQWELSLKKCDQALAIRPASAQAHYNRGCALHALMRLDEAVAAYGEATDLDPTLARAHGNLAYLLETMRGDLKGALKGYRAAIDAEPLERQHHVNLFALLKRMELYGDVVEAYDAWLEIDPEDREVREDLAYMLCVCPDADAVDIQRGMDLAQELCESSEWSAWRSLKVLAIAQLYSGLQEEGLASAKRSVELIEPERRENYRERLTLFFPEL
ncbi:MAG: tetratricopeptide repeat protein, partial [Planctomycetota bacterium]